MAQITNLRHLFLIYYTIEDVILIIQYQTALTIVYKTNQEIRLTVYPLRALCQTIILDMCAK